MLFLVIIKIDLIKGNFFIEEFLIYIFEIKYGVLIESNNKVIWYKRIWIRWWIVWIIFLLCKELVKFGIFLLILLNMFFFMGLKVRV